MTAVAIPTADAVAVLQDWLDEPETRQQLREAISRGLSRAEDEIRNDLGWRVPRQPTLRTNAFERWLAPMRTKISDSIANEVHATFPFISRRSVGQIVKLALEQIFPELGDQFERVLEDQVRFGVRGIALQWTSGEISDGLLLGLPEPTTSEWHVPLYLRANHKLVGEVQLNRDGEILTDAATLRQSIVQLI